MRRHGGPRDTLRPMKSVLAILAVPAILGMSLAVGGSAPTPAETSDVGAPSGIHVVILGSSTAEGTGPRDPANAWVNRYRRDLRDADPAARVTNLARGGYTTYQIQPDGFVPPLGRPAPDPERNITAAVRLHPDAIVINLPSNDATLGCGAGEQLANYDRVLAVAAEAGVPVWVATTQPRNLEPAGRAIQTAMRDSTFARFGKHALDFWSGFAAPDGTIAPEYDCGDGIHLNDAAHGILCERVVAADIPAALAAAR